MHDPHRTYVWEPPYIAAVLEADSEQLKIRLYEAAAAIEKRRLAPLDSDEERALLDAENGLNALIAERLNSDA